MRADYGARAMIDLAQHYGEGLTQSAIIAARQQIPESYLERLLTSLRRAGLIRSVRGPSGGHELARQPATINLDQVWDALEGSQGPDTCEGDEAATAAGVLQEIWQQIESETHRALQGVTLDELAERQGSRETRSMYHI